MDPNQVPTPPVLQQPTPLSSSVSLKKIDSKMLNKIIIGSIMLILVIIGAGAYTWRDGQAKQQSSDSAIEIQKLQVKIDKLEKELTVVFPNVDTTIGYRDGQRKNDLMRIETQVVSYESNNRGSLPKGMTKDSESSWLGFIDNYLMNGTSPLVDPSGNGYLFIDTEGKGKFKSDIGVFDAKSPTIYITVGAVCDDTNDLLLSQSTRKVAFQMKLEGVGIACTSNN